MGVREFACCLLRKSNRCHGCCLLMFTTHVHVETSQTSGGNPVCHDRIIEVKHLIQTCVVYIYARGVVSIHRRLQFRHLCSSSHCLCSSTVTTFCIFFLSPLQEGTLYKWWIIFTIISHLHVNQWQLLRRKRWLQIAGFFVRLTCLMCLSNS